MRLLYLLVKHHLCLLMLGLVSIRWVQGLHHPLLRSPIRRMLFLGLADARRGLLEKMGGR